MIDTYVGGMESDWIIENNPSAWGSTVCIVAKAGGSTVCTVAKAGGSPRFCVNYRNTINIFLVREIWPMPDIESHIDTVGVTECITVCDVQSAYWQIPIKKKYCHKTAFVTSKGKYILNIFPSAWRTHVGYFDV